MQLNKLGYKQLIDEDILWLEKNTPDTLERRHIIMVLRDSIDMYYPLKVKCPDCGKMVQKRDYDLGLHHMTNCNDYEDQ